MDIKEIKKQFALINQAIEKKQIKEAFALLMPLLVELHNSDLIDEHYNLEFTYKNILKYLSAGVKDANREQVINHLTTAIYQLTDNARIQLLTRYSNEYAYDLKREMQSKRQETIEQQVQSIVEIINDAQLKALISPSYAYPPEFDQKTINLFNTIWTKDCIDSEDQQSINQLFTNETIPWHTKALLSSAILLSLLGRWNTHLVMVLFDLSQHSDARVKMRSMVNLVFILYYYDNRLFLYPEVVNRLKLLQDDDRFSRQLLTILIQLIRTRETQRISQKLQDEIIPEVIKMQSVIREKLDLDNLIADSADDKNPEWGEILADSPELLGKLEEISKMQLEGADVFLNTFQMLKHFPFFNQLSNWFLPFFIDHPAIQAAIGESGDALKKSSLFENVGHSSFLCNSDKYSLFLSIPHMPDMQREMMGQMFKAEMEQLGEIEKDELMVNPEKRDLSISNQYIQDLYRFFKVYPQKRQFEDIFNWEMSFHNCWFFKFVFPTENELRQLGEYFFGKGYFQDTINVYNQIADNRTNIEILQKQGYCHFKLNQFNTALALFLKADLLKPDNNWTIKKIAQCYIKLKNPQKALENYLIASEKEPDNLIVQAAIGHCYIELESYEEALKYYFRVEYLAPSNVKVWRPIAWCSLVLGKFDQAEKYSQKLILSAKNHQDYINLGHVHLLRGQVKEAITCYQDSIHANQGRFDQFVQLFKDDSAMLTKHGIQPTDLALIIDQLKYSLEE